MDLYARSNLSTLMDNNSDNCPDDDLLIERFSYISQLYFSFIKRFRVYVLGFWFVLTIWGAITGFEYIRGAIDSMSAPLGSTAYNDQLAFQREFPAIASASNLIMVIGCDDDNVNCTVGCKRNECGKNCKGFNPLINNFTQTAIKKILDYSDLKEVRYSKDVLGFYQFYGTKRQAAKCEFVSEDGRTTFMIYSTVRNVESRKRYDLVSFVIKEVNPLLNGTGYHSGVTGIDPITKDGSEAAIRQSGEIDLISMPFAFCLLAYMIRSWRLLLISLLNLAISMNVALGLLNLISQASGIYPMSVTASFVEVLGLAMGIDYSLFLLRRFCDECKSGRSTELAVRLMLVYAGDVVMTSAVTIMCVFSGYCDHNCSIIDLVVIV